MDQTGAEGPEELDEPDGLAARFPYVSDFIVQNARFKFLHGVKVAKEDGLAGLVLD